MISGQDSIKLVIHSYFLNKRFLLFDYHHLNYEIICGKAAI